MTAAADLVAVQRALGLKGGLHRFVRMAWHVVEPVNSFSDNWHIGAVAEHCEALYRGQIRKLCINEPPGCMKSLLVDVFFPVWCWVQNPGYKLIAAAYDARLVGKRDGGKIIDLIQSPWFRARWGDRVMIPSDSSAGDIETSAKGFRFATSVRGPLTGRHANGITIDDPHKAQELTDNALDGAEEWYRSAASSRKLPGAWEALIMQRLHEKDLAGRVLKDRGWEHLMLPMRFDPVRACSTSIGFKDPRTESGELLWPSFKTETDVAELETTMGSQVASAQLQQKPAAAGGIIFLRPWFKQLYRVAPERFDGACLSLDCTFREKSRAKSGHGKIDYVGLGAYGRKGADFYLLDLHVERLDFPGTMKLVERKTRAWPKILAKLVEDKANGPAIVSMLKNKIPGLIERTPEGGKEARANAVAPLYEAGNVWYPDPEGAITDVTRQNEPTKLPFFFDGRPAGTDWHIDNMTGFPFGEHDDDVDVETQALIYLRSKATRFLEAMKSIKAMR